MSGSPSVAISQSTTAAMRVEVGAVHDVGQPVVAVHDAGRATASGSVALSRSTTASSAARGSVSEACHCWCQRRTCRARNPSGRPKSPSPTASGSTACSATRVSTSCSQAAAAPARVEPGQHVGPVEHDAVDERHQVERRAEHVGVGAQRDRLRHRHVGAARAR